MARVVGLIGFALFAVGAGCSPFGGGAFECTLDTECGAGTCSSGFCSFPDRGCESGLRYGEASGPSSNQCVSGATPDSGTDTQSPGDSSSCYGTGLVTACFASAPTGMKVLGADINTDTDAMCDSDPRNAAWCVIAGASIAVPADVDVAGSKPLVLVATGTIDVVGTLDVSSKRVNGQVGAGANASACSTGTAPGTSGGGAGGSFGIKGGNGGGGLSTDTTGGVAGTIIMPTTLHGGCRGQDGNGTNKGAGGNGGGALYLIAETSITVTGIVNASGAGGGSGTANRSGGGGGGAGGLIGLDAPTVTNLGSIVSHGGGGGEGSGLSSVGTPGADVTALSPAAGGAGGSIGGGDGGDGAVDGSTSGQDGGLNSGGGGGGGGGVGIIRVDRASSITGNGNVSPAAI